MWDKRVRDSFNGMTIEERYQICELLICVLDKIRKQPRYEGDDQLYESVEEMFRTIRDELPLLIESDGAAAGKILKKATELVVEVYSARGDPLASFSIH
ncbi:hypothetical protein [Rhizobium grahamii]|uniref:Uncharacterized protein n=1 Tax=Rhizobium grahamii CCGE 502 TaxID=990285 RepID=S3HV96_9HYPH|nr:hypothetical protein [Rhizobium grahamii]EPE97096.1 hypothetical protein RGCCGE502_17080 [Rhizobium grahamii CCGE 502]